MPKFIRYSLIVVALIIVALLVAPFFIDVNTYKTQIEQTVEDATGRKLSIGNINASLFPWVGIELDDVHLANREGFTDRDFASIEKLNVKLALLPLLSKNIEIKTFEMTTPKIFLERHDNGETNWGDLVSTQPATAGSKVSKPAEPEAAVAPALAALQAESLSLSAGEVIWVDGKAEPVVLADLNVTLTDVQLERPVAVKLSGVLSGNAFELSANVGPLGDLSKLDPISLPIQGRVKADNIRLTPFKKFISGWPEQFGDINSASVDLYANIEQRPDGIRLGEGTLALNAKINLGLSLKVEMESQDQLQLRRAGLNINGKDIIEIKGSVKNLSTTPNFQLRIDSQPLTRDWLAGLVPDLNSMYSAHPSAWKKIKFGTLIAGDAKQVDIRDMQLMLDEELVQISGAVVYAVPDIRLRIAARDLHMDPWLPQDNVQKAQVSGGNGTATTGGKQQVAAAEPDLRFLKPWRVTAKMQAATLFLRGMEMRSFNVKINGADGHFDLNPLSFKLAGGNVTETASLDASLYPAKWKESVHISDVQVGPLLRTLANMDMLEGTLSMDTKFRATGLTQAGVKTLNGRGNMMLRNGKIKGIDIPGTIRKFTNPGAASSGPNETDFAQLSGSFVVENGIADNQDLFMASPLLRVTGKGIVDLVRKTLDYHVEPRVVGTLIGQGDATPVRKGLTVPLHITGPFDAPKVRPEISAKMLIENAPALLNKGKVGGALGKILGGKGSNQPEGQQPASQSEQPVPPEKKLLKGLGGMIPGF